jgi:hypothetical protein
MMTEGYNHTTYTEGCPRAQSELVLYLYGELEDKSEFERHLANCERCKQALAEYRSALEIYRSDDVKAPIFELKVGTSLWDKVSEFFGSWNVKPAYLGALAVMVIIAVFLTTYWMDKNLKTPQGGTSASYSWISAELDDLEYELDNLLSFNVSNYQVEQTSVESSELETVDYPTDALLDELDELQTNMISF